MHKKPAFLLGALATLGFTPVLAQVEAAVTVRISADTCLIRDLNVPCSDVGAKLRELGVPSDADIRLSGDKSASYRAVSAALESIRSAGFQFKIGYVNVQDH